MGMYTELVIATKVKPEPEVIKILKYLCEPTELILSPLPDHPFFSCDGWRWIFVGSSNYFVPTSVSKLEYNDIAEAWSLISCASFKNYTNEIEEFVSWLSPYIDAEPGKMIGYSRYENADDPTVLRKL